MSKKKSSKKQNKKKASSRPVQKAKTTAAQKSTGFSFSYDSIPFTMVGLGLFALFLLIVRMNFFEIPMERDEGIYAYAGKMILQGKTPYIDFYEQRFPGIFYMYAVLVGLFGYSLKGLAIGIFFVNLATMGFIYFGVKKLWDNFTGILAAGAYTFLVFGPYASGFSRQSEHLMVFWATAGFCMLAYSVHSKKNLHFLFTGLLLGMSLLIKTNGVFFILAGGFSIVSFFALRKEWKEVIVKGLWYSAGVFGMFGFFCLLLAIQGAFDEMWYWAVEFPRSYVSQVGWETGMEYMRSNFKRVTQNYMLFWIPAALSLVAVFFSKMENYKKVWVWLWGIFAVLNGFSWASFLWALLFNDHAIHCHTLCSKLLCCERMAREV